jgi:hypothetical protein
LQAQFINTNLLTLTTYLISVENQRAIYYKGGLVTDVFFLLFSQMIVAPILLILNPAYIISNIKQYFLRLRVDYSLANSVTQQEAHEIYQKPEVNLAILYAALFKPMFTSVFFIQILPATTLMASVAGLAIIYAVKINIFRTSRTPPPISSAIAHTALSILNMVPLVYGVVSVYIARMRHLRLCPSAKSQQHVNCGLGHRNPHRTNKALHAYPESRIHE